MTLSTQYAYASELGLHGIHVSWSSLRSWFGSAFDAAASFPQQQGGTAAGHSHVASSASTRSGKGNGSPAGHGAGALSAYQPKAAKTPAGKSGTVVVGFDARTSKRDAKKSNATMDYYVNADGSITKHVYNGAVNYKDAVGDWQPIDSSLVKSGSGRYTNKADSFSVSFRGAAGGGQAQSLTPQVDASASPSDSVSASASPSDTASTSTSASPTDSASASASPSLTTGADGELATLDISSGESFSWNLQGAAAVTPTVSGEVATYSSILPDTDLQLISQPTGVKEQLVLASASAGNSWTFPLSLTGVSLSQASDGQYQLVDSSGNVVAALGMPTAWDSNVNSFSGDPTETWKVSYSLATVNGVEELTLTLDSSWLDDPSRVFPVTVDPTVSLVGQTDTTYVSTDCTVSCTEYSDYKLKVGYNGSQIARSFLMFPSSDFNNNGYHITSAQFAAYRFSNAGDPSYTNYNVYPLSGSWSPTEAMTWNVSSGTYKAPSLVTSNDMGIWTGSESSASTCSTSAGSLAGNWTYTSLLTGPFNSWATGNGSSYDGFGLTGAETNSNSWMEFGSDEDSGCSPYLTLTEAADVAPQVDSMAPASNTALSTLTPTLTATGQDSDSWPNANPQYQFTVYSGSTGARLKYSSWITSSTPTWTVPSGVLKWGQSYSWTVQAFDGWAYSSNKNYTFTVAAPPPVLTNGLSQNSSDHGFDPSIGNYTTSAVDANIAGVGPALEIQRNYNSLDPRTSQALGAGWSSVLDANATQVLDADGNVVEVVITNPDGSEVPYGLNADGSYSPPEGQFATVKFVSGSGYTLTDKNDTTYTFEHTDTAAASKTAGIYALSSITDSMGRTLSLSYSATTGGQVTGIASASGRHLTVKWTTPPGASSQHVTSITTDLADSTNSSSDQVWTYNYTNDQLISACTPLNECTAYQYNAETQYQNAVLDTAPASYWRLDDAAGATTVASSVLANEQADAGTASNVTFGKDASGLKATTVDGGDFSATSDSSIHLPGTSVVGQTYATVSLWFSTKAAGPLWCEQNALLSATPTNAVCSLYVGTDGYIHGGFYAGSSSGINGSTTVTDGGWHQVVLTASATQQSLYLDGKLVGSESSTINDLSMSDTYLGAGYNSTDWPDTGTTRGNWYLTGSIADVAFWKRSLSAPEVIGLHNIGTSTAQELKLITKPSGAITAQITYNNTLGRVQQVTDQNNGVWNVGTPSVKGSSQVFRSTVLGSQPGWYWPLADSAGATAAANEINSGAGGYTSATVGSSGVFPDATSATFNGSSSRVNLPSGILDSQFNVSVGLWFKTGSPNGVLFSHSQNGVSSLSTTGNYQPWLYVGADGKLVASVGVQTAIESSSPVDNSAWHYALFTVSSSTQTLYLDGKWVGTGTPHTDAVDENFVYVGSGFIGGSWPDEANSGNTTATPLYFNGSISDVALWRSTVSDETATAIYGAAKNSTGLVPVEQVTVTDPGSHSLIYDYDPENSYRETSYTDGLGNTTTYGYDTSGFQNTVTDPNGNVTTIQHDIRGNQTAKTTCQVTSSNTCSTQYWTYYPDDTTAQLTKASAENDQPVTYSDARSSSSTDPAYETTYTYNSCGERTGVTTPSVAVLANGTSTTQNLTTTTVYTTGSSSTTCGVAQLAPGSSTAYVPAGLVASVTTPGGATTTYQYFASGSLQSVTTPNGEVTSYKYDGLGRVTSKMVTWSQTYSGQTTSGSATTAYDYNGDGLLHSETDPVVTDAVTNYTHQKVTTYAHNADGLVWKVDVSDAGTARDTTRETVTTYNTLDQVQNVTDPAGHTTSYTYDAYGNKASVTDPNSNETDYTYDPNGHLTTTVLKNYTGDPVNPSTATNLTLESRAYDPAGRLQSVTDAMGRVTAYTYTDNGLVASIEVGNPAYAKETGGVQVNVPAWWFTTQTNTYDPAGELIKRVTNNGVTETDWAYDAAGRKTSKTIDPSGVDQATTYQYTADGKLAQSDATAAGSSMTLTAAYTYDTAGDEKTKTITGDSATRTTTWTYDTRGLAETEEDANSNTTTYYYDALGQQNQIVRPAITVTTFNPSSLAATSNVGANPTMLIGYDTFGEKAEVQDPDGNVTTDGFDPDGRVNQITGATYTPFSLSGPSTPVTPVTTKTYDNDGNLLTVVSPLNETTTYTYDQLGDVATITDPLGHVTHDTYDVDKELSTSTSPTATQTSATYDDLGRKTSSSVYESALSKTLTTSYAYGTSAWLQSTTTQRNDVTSYTYDNIGEKITTQDGANNTTSYTYDGFGHIAKTLYADKSYLTETYDDLGDVTSTDLYNSAGVSQSTTSATYDNLGHVMTKVDPVNVTESFTYDAVGELKTETQPIDTNTADNIVVTISYDANGNETSLRNGDGHLTYWTYNALGLQDTKTVPGVGSYTTEATRTTGYVYNTDGELTGVDEPGGVNLTYHYNTDGTLWWETGSGAEAASLARVYSYYGDGALKTAQTCSDTSCGTVDSSETYAYNSEDELASVTSTNAGNSSFTYNEDGLMASRTDASGTSTYTYDSADRLATDQDAASGQTLTYGYNSLNQLTTLTYSGGDYQSYGYNTLGEVTSDKIATSANARVAEIDYGYNNAGEMTSKTEYGISAATSSGSTANTYGYDEAGRLTSWKSTPSSTGTTTTVTYGYDGDGNRTNVNGVPYIYDYRDELTSDGTNTYTYTARGTLASQTVTATGVESAYNFDAYGQEATAGSASYTYDALGRALTAGTTTLTYSGQDNQVASDGTTTYSRDPSGTIMGTETTATAAKYSAWVDAHDDLVAEFPATSQYLSGWMVYDPLGKAVSTSGAQVNIGYQSEYTDAATGQVNMNARWYSPSQGQFTSADTWNNSTMPNVDNANPYAYADASPLNGTDPSGHLAGGNSEADFAYLYDIKLEGEEKQLAEQGAADEEEEEYQESEDAEEEVSAEEGERSIKRAEASEEGDVGELADEAAQNDDANKSKSSNSDRSGSSSQGRAKPIVINPIATRAGDLKASSMGRVGSALAESGRIGVDPVTNRSASGAVPLGSAVASQIAHQRSGGSGGTTTTSNDSGDTCLNSEPDGAVALNGGGWVLYNTDGEGRNAGALACLAGKASSSRGESAEGDIPGWGDAIDRAEALGFTPASDYIARCHTVPRLAGGTADARNLTPCWQLGANINQRSGGGVITNTMRTFERGTASDMNNGQAVLYSVVINYRTADSTIPWSWRMVRLGQDRTTGMIEDFGTALVTNSRYNPSGNLMYLGN